MHEIVWIECKMCIYCDRISNDVENEVTYANQLAKKWATPVERAQRKGGCYGKCACLEYKRDWMNSIYKACLHVTKLVCLCKLPKQYLRYALTYACKMHCTFRSKCMNVCVYINYVNEYDGNSCALLAGTHKSLLWISDDPLLVEACVYMHIHALKSARTWFRCVIHTHTYTQRVTHLSRTYIGMRTLHPHLHIPSLHTFSTLRV